MMFQPAATTLEQCEASLHFALDSVVIGAVMSVLDL
jgi:hypothetical protein